MPENRDHKPRYEPPVVLLLGELAAALGACTNGADVDTPCSNGNQNVGGDCTHGNTNQSGSCGTGNNVTSQPNCSAGTQV